MEKILHSIWIGDKPRPVKWMDSWKNKNPDWDYILWDDEKVRNYPIKNKKQFDTYYERGRFDGATDVLRYQILEEFGGFTAPADMECIRPLEGLFDKGYVFAISCLGDPKDWEQVGEDCGILPLFLQQPENWKSIVTPIIAAKKGNAFIKKVNKEISNICVFRTPAQTTGNALIQRMIKRHKPRIKVFPMHYFMPYHPKAKKTGKAYRYIGKDKPYANHYWGSSLKNYEKDIVYLLDTKKESKILPLSIRTAKKTIPHRKIFIVGKKPKKVEAEEIYIEDVESKPIENICKKLKAVIDDNRVSDDFILMNDDFIMLERCDIIKYYHQGKIKDYKPNSYWKNRIERLKELFPEGNFYELHFPIVYNKAKLREVLEKIDIEGGLRTYYCNYHNIEGEYHEDHKIYQRAKIKDHAEAPFLSTSQVVENTRLGEIENIIKKRGL